MLKDAKRDNPPGTTGAPGHHVTPRWKCHGTCTVAITCLVASAWHSWHSTNIKLGINRSQCEWCCLLYYVGVRWSMSQPSHIVLCSCLRHKSLTMSSNTVCCHQGKFYLALAAVASHSQQDFGLVWFILHPCQHNDGYIDGRSQIKVHTDERTQVLSARSSLTVTVKVDVA